MMGFAGFTTNKTLAAKVKKFFALAPVATVKHIRGLFYYISEFYKEVEVVERGVWRVEGREGMGKEERGEGDRVSRKGWGRGTSEGGRRKEEDDSEVMEKGR